MARHRRSSVSQPLRLPLVSGSSGLEAGTRCMELLRTNSGQPPNPFIAAVEQHGEPGIAPKSDVRIAVVHMPAVF